MIKSRAIVFFAALTCLALGSEAMAGSGVSVRTPDSPFLQTVGTTQHTAMFAQLFASGQFPDGEGGLTDPSFTAISISNVLEAPPGDSFVEFREAGQRVGTIEFHLWNFDGTQIFYETNPDSPGVDEGRLDDMGMLAPGHTYTVLLSEILEAAGFVDDEGDALPFLGYGWVVGNFDAIQGTYNLTFFEIGFTQNFSFEPTMGSGGFFGGIPVFVNGDNGNGGE